MNSVLIVDASDFDSRLMSEIGMGMEQIAREIYEHRSRTQMPIIVIEAGAHLTSESMTPSPTAAKPTTELRATSKTPTAEQSS